MELNQAIQDDDVELAEKILIKMVEENPLDIDLRIKLVLTELQAPFHDYISAFRYLDEIDAIDPHNIKSQILRVLIHYISFGMIVDETYVDKLLKTNAADDYTNAIIHFLISKHYRKKENIDLKKYHLELSIKLSNQFVYPLGDYADILYLEGEIESAQKYLNQAISNVTMIYRKSESYDFTSYDDFLKGYLLGTGITEENYFALQQKLKKYRTD